MTCVEVGLHHAPYVVVLEPVVRAQGALDLAYGIELLGRQ
jgi:hypothetical protein